MKHIWVVVLLTGLAACGGFGGYTMLGTERADRGYRATTYNFTSDGGPVKVLVYTKFSEQTGQVRACGYAVGRDVGSAGGITAQTLSVWFENSTLHLAGEAMGSGAFVRFRAPERDDFDTDAICVLFARPWNSAYRTTTPEFKGSPVTVKF